MATHSSILAWRIPWSEEPGRVQSMGSQESDMTEQLIHTHTHTHTRYLWTFPGGSAVKNLSAKAGNTGSIPGMGRSPGGENGNPLQYFCLGNPMDRGAWQATIHGVTE